MRGAPPSPEALQQEHRSTLASRGCQVCGHDDPDDLQMVPLDGYSTCTAFPGPAANDVETAVLCDEHHRPAHILQDRKILQRARHDGATHVVRYTCWSHTFITDDRHPAQRARGRTMGPDGPVRCACGAGISEVIDIPNNPRQPSFDPPAGYTNTGP